MLLPRLDNCIICEIVRGELNGKLTILGFFGVCPNVDVQLSRMDQPAVLTFLVTGPPGDGDFAITFAVIDEADGRVVAETAELPFVARPNAVTNLAPTLMLTFGRPGMYALRCVVNGAPHYRASFKVSQSAIPSGVAL